MAEVKDGWFQKAESRLYAYPALVARHRTAIYELKLVPAPKAAKYTAAGFIRGSEPAGEAERWIIRKEKLIQRALFLDEQLQNELDKMSALWELLREDEQTYAALRYFEQKSRSFIIDRIARSYPTCEKIRGRVVLKAAYVFEFLDYEQYMKLLAG